MLKDASVSLKALTTPMLAGWMMVEKAYDDCNYDCIVTSANDGIHGRGSLHFSGNALDFRTKHVERDDLDILVATVKGALGENEANNEYDVILEFRDQPNEHLHVEFQPKVA